MRREGGVAGCGGGQIGKDGGSGYETAPTWLRDPPSDLSFNTSLTLLTFGEQAFLLGSEI